MPARGAEVHGGREESAAAGSGRDARRGPGPGSGPAHGPGGLGAGRSTAGLAEAGLHSTFPPASPRPSRSRSAQPSSASIWHCKPLPMPSSATRSPARTKPASIASESESGSDTEPTLPKRSTVG